MNYNYKYKYNKTTEKIMRPWGYPDMDEFDPI